MELGQVVAEVGPLIALCWYLLRLVCVFTVWSAYLACKNVFQKPVLLMAALLNLPYLLMGVVYNHTANMLLFGVTGLAFVSLLEPTVKRRFPQGRRQIAAPGPSQAPVLEGASAK
jgi:predicted LPLAT superfamily acyltransferase